MISTARPRADRGYCVGRRISMASSVALGILVLFTLLSNAPLLRAQSGISVYPDRLYAGVNVVTITAGSGLARVQLLRGGFPQDIRTGLTLPNLRIIGAPLFGKCGKKTTLMILVQSNIRTADLALRITDCKGRTRNVGLSQPEFWTVMREDFGRMRVGESKCQSFHVTMNQVNYVIDSIASPSPLFTIRYTGRRPPLRIVNNGTYSYDVCFTARRAGVMKIPIFVFLRRDQPAGGYSTFIVADTAFVTVVNPPPRPVPPTRPRPIPPVVVRRPDPPPPPPPPRIPDVDTVALAEIDPGIPRQLEEPDVATIIPSIPPPEPGPIDPTTFRTVILPTARSIEDGKGFLANYDIVGWLAGYGITDRFSVTGGLLVLPGFIGNIFDATAGAKYEIYREGAVRGAIGAQLNYSSTDSSSIALAAPYAVVSLGDDDRRATLLLGYSARRHEPVNGSPFGQQAMLVGIGGDYRIGRNWKVASELALLDRSEYQPLIATVRYFTDDYALDAGVGVNLRGLVGSGALQPAPMVSFVWVW